MTKLKVVKCSKCGNPVWITKKVALCAFCKMPCSACPDKMKLMSAIANISNTKKLLDNVEFRKWITNLGKELDVDIRIEKKRKR